MSTKKFQRTKEDFVCEKCGASVEGDGYTNHCPTCLWSKHVDIHPGDRAELCQGLMEPVLIEVKSGEHRIVHRCVKCGFSKRNKVSEEDNFDRVLEVSKKER